VKDLELDIAYSCKQVLKYFLYVTTCKLNPKPGTTLANDW